MATFVSGFLAQLREVVVRPRNQLMLVLFLGASAICIATYRQGAMRELPVALLDADGTGLSRTLARAVDATPELRVVTDPPATLDDAEAAVIRGELVGVILIPDGFTAALKRGRPAEVVVAAALSNILSGKTVQRTMAKVLATVGAGVQVSALEKLGTPPSVALATALPITATEALPRNPGASFAVYMAPAFAYFFLHLVALFLAWAVLWPVAPERGAAELLGRFGACLALAFALGLVTTYALLPLDGIWPASSFPVVAAALLAFLAVDLLFAAGLEALFRGSLIGFQLTVLLGMLSMMFSGLPWPWDLIPAPIRVVASAIPFIPFARAIRIFLHQPAGLADLAWPFAWLGLQALGWSAAIAAAASLAAGAAALRRRLS